MAVPLSLTLTKSLPWHHCCSWSVANIEAEEEDKRTFAFMTMGDSDIKVQPPPPPETVTNSDSCQSYSCNKIINQDQRLKRVRVGSDQTSKDPVILYTKTQNRPILIDSGVSNHCFADKSMFSSYIPFEKPSEGLSAGEGLVFSIVGKGDVKFQTYMNGKTRNIILEDVLHTPGLRSNLISVSKLEEKGAGVIFRNGKAIVELADSSKVLSAVKSGRMYTVKLDGMPSETFIAQSNQKSASFDTWHRRLAHAGADIIREMISKQLVDGLHTYGDLAMKGQCEDCIYGKHTSQPYNENTTKEKDVLEWVHIDIWGPAQTQSAGGSRYFMMMMDSFSSYRTVAFLSSKSADITLKVFKSYQTEAEHQTGKKMRQVRLDMGREWYNTAWEQYRKDQGLDFQFTTPYAHQQNGAAECSMHTILDRAHSAMAESGIPLKYWADAVSTVVYVQNLIPSSRQPGTIPAELWSQRRQNVSYLCPFGTMAYAHIPSDLSLSKLFPQSVKVALLGYFGHDGYKLLERDTGAIFRSRNVIFKERTTHYVKQLTPTPFTDEDDPFPYRSNNQTQIIEENRNNDIEGGSEHELVGPPLQVIAPRPLTITELYKDKHEGIAIQTSNKPPPEPPANDYELQYNDNNILLAVRRSQRPPKLTNRLIESREYLSQPHTFAVDTDTWIPKTFNEAMKKPDLWWEPMVKEFEILKE